jgi:hypothetical protein
MDSDDSEQADATRRVVVFRRDPSTALTGAAIDAGSFRDRSSRVFVHQKQVYRALSGQARAEWRRVSEQAFFQQLMSVGRIIPTRELSPDEANPFRKDLSCAAVLRHERVPFVTYPYEWSFSMLREAALLHLDILAQAIQAGTILKDSSPYNVQFIGTRPVFIDVGSFETLIEGEAWRGYRQFCEMLLFPLLLQSYRHIDIQPVLRVKLDGISAREFLRPLSWRDMLRPGVFAHGWLQAMLEGQADSSTQTDTINALKSSGFDRKLIERNINQLSRLVRRLKWNPDWNHWSGYRQQLKHVQQDTQLKSEFVAQACQQRRRLVWDLGCNDGHFSRIAAKNADTVLAMDQDHGCIERLYLELAAENCANIVPTVIDLLNPSAALGWRGRERARLETRGEPDLILCLGLIHHLVIAGNIPLPEVVDWLASLNADVVLEFPGKRDPMVRNLLRNKVDQYDDYSLSGLEAALQASGLQVQQRTTLPSGERTLLYIVRQNPTGAV